MNDWFEYLSGNVPGGFGLYLLFVLVVLLTLWGISRKNELFTPRHFRLWFFTVWGVTTLIYLVVWLSDPPPAAFSRYSVHIHTGSRAERWLADYFSEEISGIIKPYRDATDYYYPQRWNYLAGVDCALSPAADCIRMARNLPFRQWAAGQIVREGKKMLLRLQFYGDKDTLPRDPIDIPFSANRPQEILPAVATWLKKHLPVKEKLPRPALADSLLTLAKTAFYTGDYQKSLQLCQTALRRHPGHPEIGMWVAYNQIRQARALRKDAPPRNPFEAQKPQWQLQSEKARRELLAIMQQKLDRLESDALLSNMIAEEFILEEKYGDAEQFLKIAFGENPFLLEALKNWLSLHESRYEGMPFRSRQELMSRILNICPVEEEVLREYIEGLMLNLQVSDAPVKEIRTRIERALALNPGSFTARLLDGKFHILQFDYPAALRAFLTADSIKPGQAVTHYNLGITYFKLKDNENAEVHFQKAIDINDYRDAHLYLGVIYQERGEYEKALVHFRHRVKIKSGDDDYYAVQAMKGIQECLKALGRPIPGPTDGQK